MSVRKPFFLDHLWRFFASERCTGILVVLLATLVLLGLTIPQGKEALAVATDGSAVQLHRAARWGLTNVFQSAWLKALGVLMAGNLVAMLTDSFFRTKGAGTIDLAPPQGTQFRTELSPRFPEQTASKLKDIFVAFFGVPSVEMMKGEKTIMVFDAGRAAQWAPVVTHLGLVTLLLSIGLQTLQFDERSSSPQAILRVTDPKSGSSGVFNLRAGEQRNFFAFPDTYLVRHYERAKDGLGPAVLLERRRKNAERGESFWIYKNAPIGFDSRHRKGQVVIEALELRLVPLPGVGLINSPIVLLLLLGVALCFVGLIASRQAGGRIWIEFERRQLQISGAPRKRNDPLFEREFEHCMTLVRASIEST